MAGRCTCCPAQGLWTLIQRHPQYLSSNTATSVRWILKGFKAYSDRDTSWSLGFPGKRSWHSTSHLSPCSGTSIVLVRLPVSLFFIAPPFIHLSVLLAVTSLRTLDDPNASVKWGTLRDLVKASRDPESQIVLNALSLPMGDISVAPPPKFRYILLLFPLLCIASHCPLQIFGFP